MLPRQFFHFLCNNRTVFDMVLSAFSQATIAQFSTVDKAAHVAVCSYTKRAFDINKHLLGFFDNPLAFRRLQQHSGMLISGSNALQFMARTHYPDSDLDLYVEAKYASDVGGWLLANGYSFAPARMQPESYWDALKITFGSTPQQTVPPSVEDVDEYDSSLRGMENVFTFYGFPSSRSGLQTKVQLITASNTPMEVILQFHSTCVMNFISHANAYSLYPRATFLKHQSLLVYNPRDTVNGLLMAHAKWRARGWTMLPLNRARTESADASFIERKRSIGDRDTWCIPLDTTGLQRGPLLSDCLKIHSWKLSHDMLHIAALGFWIVSSPALRFKYLTSGRRDCITPLLADTLAVMEDRRVPSDLASGEEFHCDQEIERLCVDQRRLVKIYARIMNDVTRAIRGFESGF